VNLGPFSVPDGNGAEHREQHEIAERHGHERQAIGERKVFGHGLPRDLPHGMAAPCTEDRGHVAEHEHHR